MTPDDYEQLRRDLERVDPAFGHLDHTPHEAELVDAWLRVKFLLGRHTEHVKRTREGHE